MRSKSLISALFVSGLITYTAFAQDQYFLPQVANGLFSGGSFRTTFVVVNNTDSTATAVLALTQGNGEPLEVTIPGLGTQGTFTLTLSPGATRILQTDGSGNLLSGAATVTSDVPLGVSAVFTVLDPVGNLLTEAGVGDSPALPQFTFPVQVGRTLDTGIALYNPSTSAVTLRMRLLDAEGAVVGTTELTLPPKNQAARFASELFAIADFIGGSIAVTGTGEIAALVLRQNTSAGTPTYTNLPVTSGVSQGTAEGTMIGAAPTQIKDLSEVVWVSDSAVVKSDGTVWILRPTYDADRKTVASLTPTRVDGLGEVAAVSGGMALKRDGTVWQFYGPLPVQVSGLSDVMAIDDEGGTLVALKRDGTAWAWWDTQSPFQLDAGTGAVAVASTSWGALVLRSDGTVREFSFFFFTSLDLGGSGFVAIDGGDDYSLAVKSDGTVWALGYPRSAQQPGVTGAVAISIGNSHYLVLVQDGTVWEWGHSLVRQVAGLTGVAQIADCHQYSLALRSDGTVWAWGYD